MKFKIGQKAKLKVHVPDGVVIDTRYDTSHEKLQHLLEYVGHDGEVHHVWFNEEQLAESKGK